MTATVSTTAILFMFITLLISLFLPIVLTIVLFVKKKIRIAPVLVGAGVFFVFQLIIRIPALSIAEQLSPAFKQFVQGPLWGGLFLGLTAGIFEEFGRYIGYKVGLKRHTAWSDGFAFGIGHGGIEAIALAGLASINNILYALVINSGKWSTIANALPAETADTLFRAMTETAPHLFLVGGIERLFAMTIQIALSILVLYAIRRRKFTYVLLAVLLHLIVDSPVMFLLNQFGILGTELYVMVCAAAAAVYIVLSRKIFAKLDTPNEQWLTTENSTSLDL